MNMITMQDLQLAVAYTINNTIAIPGRSTS